MADGWFIKRDAQKYGPYSSTQMVEMAKKGQVLPLDWVAQGENGQWMPASQVKGLFAAPTQGMAVPPPLPVAGSLSSPVDAFAFDGGPVQDDEGASTHASRKKRPVSRLNKVILAAMAGGVLLVILVVTAIFLGGAKQGKDQSATSGAKGTKKLTTS